MAYANAIMSEHALAQLTKRGLTPGDLLPVLQSPDAVLPVRPGRVVLHKHVLIDESSKEYLLRVFVDVDRQPPEVVTAYRTSKIDKGLRKLRGDVF